MFRFHSAAAQAKSPPDTTGSGVLAYNLPRAPAAADQPYWRRSLPERSSGLILSCAQDFGLRLHRLESLCHPVTAILYENNSVGLASVPASERRPGTAAPPTPAIFHLSLCPQGNDRWFKGVFPLEPGSEKAPQAGPLTALSLFCGRRAGREKSCENLLKES